MIFEATYKRVEFHNVISYSDKFRAVYLNMNQKGNIVNSK